MRKFLLFCSPISCSFAQSIFPDFSDSGFILTILFYLNLLFIGIITYLAPRGKRMLSFLTLILENVFILLIAVKFGLENLSILLFIANPFILFMAAMLMIKNKNVKEKNLEKTLQEV